MFLLNNLLDFERIIMTVPGILLAITLHELAHGYSAYLMGDPTAKDGGRLSFNPLAHLDPFGFIMLLVVGFGWAKPVPVNPYYFKRYKLGMFIVSIAGVVTNFILAIILSIALGLQLKYYPHELISNIIFRGITINFALAVFNLIPIPPLDGSKIVATVLPRKWEHKMYELERYANGLLILLLFTGVIDKIMGPSVAFLMNSVAGNILSFIFFRG